jgi:hypothetical protein
MIMPPSLRVQSARMIIVGILAILVLGTIDLLLPASATRAAYPEIRAPALTLDAQPAIQSSKTITIIYSQPPSGTLFRQSSQLGYDQFGSDYDQYVWDDFMLSATSAITEIGWRGEYLSNGLYGAITDFVVSLYTSTAAGWQPDVINPPLAQYVAGNTANETPPWTAGQPIATFHDYQFALPTPFTAEADVKYWVQIEGIQPGPTDWGVVGGGNGSGVLFYAIPGIGDFQYFRAPGDIAFTLTGSAAQPPIVYDQWVYLPLMLR